MIPQTCILCKCVTNIYAIPLADSFLLYSYCTTQNCPVSTLKEKQNEEVFDVHDNIKDMES